MLEIEGEVLSPSKESGIRLAELVIIKRLVCEGLLNVLKRLSLSFYNFIVDLKISGHRIDHLLDKMRVLLEVFASLRNLRDVFHVDER